MKTKLLSFFLLVCGISQFTSAFNVSDEINESSTVLTLDSFTFADDATDLTITVNGTTVDSASHHLYIDVDNNPATGDPDNGGADFRVENTSTNRWDAVTSTWLWEWHAGNVVVTNNPGVSVQFTIDRVYLPLPNSGSQINVYFTNTVAFAPVGDPLPLTGMESYTTTTGTPPPSLDSLTISNDITTITATVFGPTIGATYDAFIDTDNNVATGYLIGGIGADVLLEAGGSYDFNVAAPQTAWAWVAHVTSAINSETDVAGVSREFVLDRTILGLAASGITFQMIYAKTEFFAIVEQLPAVTYTTITLSVENLLLDNVSIYKTNYSTLNIAGSIEGKSNVKLYDMLGKEVLNSSFNLNGEQEIALPKLATGIYIVRLETELGTLSKKIVL